MPKCTWPVGQFHTSAHHVLQQERWREMIRLQAAWRAAWRPQAAVKLDWNLKPKLAIMRQCTSVTDRRTDGQTDGQPDEH